MSTVVQSRSEPEPEIGAPPHDKERVKGNPLQLVYVADAGAAVDESPKNTPRIVSFSTYPSFFSRRLME